MRQQPPSSGATTYTIPDARLASLGYDAAASIAQLGLSVCRARGAGRSELLFRLSKFCNDVTFAFNERQAVTPDLQLLHDTRAYTGVERRDPLGPTFTDTHTAPSACYPASPGMRNQSTKSLDRHMHACARVRRAGEWREELTATPDQERSAPLMRDVWSQAVTSAHTT